MQFDYYDEEFDEEFSDTFVKIKSSKPKQKNPTKKDKNTGYRLERKTKAKEQEILGSEVVN